MEHSCGLQRHKDEGIMNIIDTVILIIVGFCGLLGLYWGLIRQVLAVTGLLAGITLATLYERDVASLLSSVITNDTLGRAVAFVLIILIVSGIASLIASLLRKLIGLIFLGWADHAIGGVLGLVQGVMVCTVFLIVSAALPNDLWSPLVRESQFAPLLVQASGGPLFAMLPESFRLSSTMTFGVP
jgi:membrane protein required for colicin V production